MRLSQIHCVQVPIVMILYNLILLPYDKLFWVEGDGQKRGDIFIYGFLGYLYGAPVGVEHGPTRDSE